MCEVHILCIHVLCTPGLHGERALRALDGVNTRFGKHIIIKCER